MMQFAKAALIVWLSAAACPFVSCAAEESANVKLRPIIDGTSWLIGPEPNLAPLDLQPAPGDTQPNQPNDHCIFQTNDGVWHLWACVRQTKIGRILCHWEAKSLTESPWKFTGEIIRADKSAGESLVEWRGQEFIQSPFVVKDKRMYYMFYGGYDTGLDPNGRKLDAGLDYNTAEKQICLMTSSDGRKWTRHRDKDGYSRVFVGPGAARDECIVRLGDTWYAYYAGHHNCDRDAAGIYVRTSSDLIHWSDWRIAQYDPNCLIGGHKWQAESPVVVYRGGYYYLFRTHGPDRSGTWVFRSTNPLDFSLNKVELVTILDVIAPEIVIDETGREYISNIRGETDYRISLAKLRWEKDE